MLFVVVSVTVLHMSLSKSYLIFLNAIEGKRRGENALGVLHLIIFFICFNAKFFFSYCQLCFTIITLQVFFVPLQFDYCIANKVPQTTFTCLLISGVDL